MMAGSTSSLEGFEVSKSSPRKIDFKAFQEIAEEVEEKLKRVISNLN